MWKELHEFGEMSVIKYASKFQHKLKNKGRSAYRFGQPAGIKRADFYFTTKFTLHESNTFSST